MTTDRISISLVIPAYNEEKVIAQNLKKILAYFTAKKITFEIIVVNDASSDKTGVIVADLARRFCQIRAISSPVNKGKGFSVNCGMLAASGDYIAFCDADLSTPIEELDKMLALTADNYDIIIGERTAKGSVILNQTVMRRGMGRVFNFITRLLGLTKFHDTQCGFKLFTRRAAHDIFKMQKHMGFCFDVEILYLAGLLGYAVKPVPVVWLNRRDSKIRVIRDSLRMLLGLFIIKIRAITGQYEKR
ncbi:MAG: glycosyltransferase family 2 protein [Candidatus Omnitrophica bacterium]|jgi:dolichyl-phosphate beta-glucosyltransferase|nr:glycosyltransferase family 2 protein [Candidatus Omnitrophota bacterium]